MFGLTEMRTFLFFTMTIGISTAGVERIISIINVVKTSRRSGLLQVTINDLLAAKFDEYSCGQYPSQKAMKVSDRFLAWQIVDKELKRSS